MTKFTDTLIIYGCGGHARSIADVAIGNGTKQLIFVDQNALPDEKMFGFDVVTTFPHDSTFSCILALGDNHKRSLLFHSLQKIDQSMPALISNRAYIGKNAKIANGVFIGHDVHLGPNVEIAENSIINTRALIEHDCKVGKHSHVSINAVMAGHACVGDFVMVGAGAVVIDNVKICSHVIIGAGAVVKENISKPGTYVGVPARKVK